MVEGKSVGSISENYNDVLSNLRKFYHVHHPVASNCLHDDRVVQAKFQIRTFANAWAELRLGRLFLLRKHFVHVYHWPADLHRSSGVADACSHCSRLQSVRLISLEALAGQVLDQVRTCLCVCVCLCVCFDQQILHHVSLCMSK